MLWKGGGLHSSLTGNGEYIIHIILEIQFCIYKSKKIFLLLEFNFITKILLHFKIVDVFNLWHEHTYDVPIA